MVRWNQPPEHFGDLIKQIPPESARKESIRDPNANVTDIVWYLLKCIFILAKEIHYLKSKQPS